MSKISKVQITNLKAISNIEADFNGCSVIVTGGNDKGKTTFLKSLPDRIRGEKPELILKDNESDGKAEMDLTTGEKFIWEFSDKKKEKLMFITKDGIKTSVTKEISDRFFPPVFDIDKFLQSQPKKQSQMLQEMVGIDFSDIEKRYKEAYEDRTYKNRKLAEEKAKVTPVDKDLPEKEEDVSSLQTELANIDSHNDKYQLAKDRLDDLKKTKEDTEAEIKKLQDKLKETNEKIKTGEDWLKDSNNQPKTEDQKQQIQKQIDDIVAKNTKIRDNNKAKDQQKQYEEAKKAAEGQSKK